MKLHLSELYRKYIFSALSFYKNFFTTINIVYFIPVIFTSAMLKLLC